MKAIMVMVIGATSCDYTQIAPDPAAAKDAIAVINAEFDKGAPYVYGFVNSLDAWLSASDRGADRIAPFVNAAKPVRQLPGKGKPEAEHILTITGNIEEYDTDSYAVPVWSWGSQYIAVIPKAHLAGYVAGCLHGKL